MAMTDISQTPDETVKQYQGKDQNEDRLTGKESDPISRLSPVNILTGRMQGEECRNPDV